MLIPKALSRTRSHGTLDGALSGTWSPGHRSWELLEVEDIPMWKPYSDETPEVKRGSLLQIRCTRLTTVLTNASPGECPCALCPGGR